MNETRRPERCRACGGKEMWHVFPMRDMTLLGDTVHAGSVNGIAPLETFVCGRCGYTEWFAVAPPEVPDPSRGLFTIADDGALIACARCKGQAHFLVSRVHERSATGVVTWPLSSVPGSYFALTLCAGCGRIVWFGSHKGDGRPAAAPCPRCGGPRREAPVIESANYTEVPFAVARIAGEEIGLFYIEACTPCGLVDWYAKGTLREAADAACRIERSYVAPTGQKHDAGGPYR